MSSNALKQRTDYKLMMHYIDSMLAKPIAEPVPGSILLGKKYAAFYKKRIEEFLCNPDILEELQKQAQIDLEAIQKDCEKRAYWSQNVADNDYMISMIQDFVLSI
jgi:hypothetical protein